MSKKALLINYKYCSGCHSCEIACRNHLQCGLGKWGIKLTEIQPFEAHPGDWNWDYVPVPTKLCDQCAERVEAGEIVRLQRMDATGRRIERVRVAVYADQPAGRQPPEDFARMSAAAQRAVEVHAVRTDGQPLEAFVQQHGTMVKLHFTLRSERPFGCAPTISRGSAQRRPRGS